MYVVLLTKLIIVLLKTQQGGYYQNGCLNVDGR